MDYKRPVELRVGCSVGITNQCFSNQPAQFQSSKGNGFVLTITSSENTALEFKVQPVDFGGRPSPLEHPPVELHRPSCPSLDCLVVQAMNRHPDALGIPAGARMD
ncbi:hypothetical protein PCANC_28127 [Puccinia coronata f. sp. avenae]|uniref:Uncharacterized protein n=1 Tax=Puccinia coronata f. sp. avenae TaxID=200324 RepID=A0A2N5RVL7_9BASI|nr:hypothetical protein PCANC_28127 [Puccinia coronata f. sp. avenae]